ncbi:hypothetical protein NCCP2222_18980 [Sporosarcina sp. NCCP-2222]|nr:hypothetical protein NCCP2222_18980 [Sporosarcina sp. NCCP-2222]
MLEREVKVKEFNRTFFLSTLTAMFALSTVMFTLLSNAITARSEIDPSVASVLGLAAFVLSPIIIIISYNSFVSDKSYRRTNRLLLFVSIAKKYKQDTNIL